ncbi:MAG: response regulator [Sulfurimonas sp.]|uniref:response regulator n=1 Tax=Sulfurimonas sp. TaxID=2022749 RepID=UPI002614A6E7|nr:response regulator [Sulfurimonas sp.]MDD5372678.1 response regulator [Sulfurimonas sp.]
MKPKILIVDDEKSIQKLLDLALGAGGYSTIQATTAKDGLLYSLNHLPNLILLDLTLPDMDGKDFLKQLREWSTIPVIVLSSRDNEEAKIALLEGGADDYVTKPFSTGELLARIKATLRRFETENCTSTIIESENLTLDINNHTIHLDSNELKCTPKEFELLKLFMKHKGKVLTYNWLLKEVWGVGYQQEIHYLRIFINQLRQKIEPNPSRPTRIRTETGIGYRFIG